jgi:ParB-like chromosome segregation protein Spo0J
MSLARQIKPKGEGTAATTSTGEYRSIDLHAIRLDQSAQPREALNNDRIAEYADAMKAGDQFPPLTVFHDGKTYWLADGFHRHYAAQHAGRKHIRCYVRQGGLRDAILWSVGANAKHGLARSDEDKKRAVMRLLDDAEWSQWSDREIARRCRVSDKTVAKYRPAASADDPQIERKVQRGGTVYTQKVAKAAKSNAREALVNDEPSPEAGPQAEASPAGIGAGTLADREGRHEGEAASVDLPTIPDAEREADAIQSPFDSASDEGRALFLARNNLTPTKKGGDDAKSAQVPAEHCDLINRRRQDDTHEHDRSESRQVRSGRNIAGVAAPRVGTSTEAPAESVEISASNSPSDDDAFSEVKGTARPENANSVEPSSSDNPSAAPTVEPEATPSPPPASGTPSNPQPVSLTTADKAEASTSSPSASANLSKPFVLRPHCLHPDLCAGSGSNHCWSCKKAMAEREAA